MIVCYMRRGEGIIVIVHGKDAGLSLQIFPNLFVFFFFLTNTLTLSHLAKP